MGFIATCRYLRGNLQVRLNCVETHLGWPNGLSSFFASTQKSQKTHFKADISCISLADDRLMDVTQLALTWVGWPKGEKLASTCVRI